MNFKKIVNVSICLAMLSVSTGLWAQNESRWQNVDINQQNREPRRASFFADRKSTRLNSSHSRASRMPSSA